MKNMNWNIIFKLNTFRDHLSNNDLIQVSMSSKQSRNLLAKHIFSTLNLCSFTSSRDYSSLFIKEETDKYCNKFNTFINPYKPLESELIKSIKEFSNELKLFKGSPNKLVVDGYGSYHYLLNEVPIIFPNITTLVINDSEFTMDTLKFLLDNFKCVENLELTDNLIFHNAEASYDYTINYPISLRSLKLRKNSVMMVQDKVNPVGIYWHKEGSGIHDFNGTYQYLPNLITFDYNTDCRRPEDTGDIFGFVRLNPQLKRLILSGNIFNFELFDVIKNCENLTHLEFKCLHYPDDLKNYEMPVLYNIKHLHIKIGQQNIDAMVIDKFPNLTELVIEFHWSISNEKNILIESFPNLKSLKFISNRISKYIENLTIPKLDYLEKLEFNLNWGEESFEHVIWDVSACDKLKLVNFTKNDSYTPYENLELSDELTKQWDMYYFPHKFAYYKKS
ncbi:hypothetical protein CONCODRAFT_87519 [Conidiobolus coronatus NRRL 28638]|uniref:F-box domain-containing protein n=1 Tax=Conidiobolus coronatus (strain ATCC 28846 / CBS 209.66 / NRRL 28638) TaxID=796925 RepID=A0A137NTZ0_CONC2|nr:hypothetical protein CONCODRAFT_87519 [Conidiobolus coronatus NRRL 28638]|eukprot:KXN66265.1 hypothetical protein CONCODRAFT_87519 [Conidiobolus coronatus NRRL 28638]